LELCCGMGFHGNLWSKFGFGVDVPRCTREIFRFLTKNGIFILQINTDFSGRRPEDEIHHNRLEEDIKLFRPLGEIIFISDWAGKILKNQDDAETSKNSIIIATRKASAPKG
jgi:hypothetical protein